VKAASPAPYLSQDTLVWASRLFANPEPLRQTEPLMQALCPLCKPRAPNSSRSPLMQAQRPPYGRQDPLKQASSFLQTQCPLCKPWAPYASPKCLHGHRRIQVACKGPSLGSWPCTMAACAFTTEWLFCPGHWSCYEVCCCIIYSPSDCVISNKLWWWYGISEGWYCEITITLFN